MAIAPTRQPQRRAAARRPRHRYKPIKIKRQLWGSRLLLTGGALCAAVLAWAALARATAPKSNTSRDHFDAIVVLGAPADADGNPTPEQMARVTEAVREYERGVAPRLIFSGGALKNQYVEAEVMARTAAAQGIPPSAIFTERRSKSTLQNACYTARLAREHAWKSVEIVSSASHLPRVGLVFSREALEWRTHAAPSLRAADEDGRIPLVEIVKTARYLVYGRWAEGCEP